MKISELKHIDFKKSKRIYIKTINIVMSKILVFMSLYAIIFLTSCGSEKEEKEEETKFLVTSPLKTDTVINKDYVCQIRAIQHNGKYRSF